MSKLFFVLKFVALIVLLQPLHSVADVTEDDIVGQWRQVMTNPRYPNTVARRYMRHSFFDDGTALIEVKEDSEQQAEWEVQDGLVVVTYQSDQYSYIESYELRGKDKLVKTRMQRFINGEANIDRKKDEEFIRQGSSTEKSMKIHDIFASTRDAMNFIDPTTLQVGNTYILSKKTPLMTSNSTASYSDVMSALKEVVYLGNGDSITIVDKEEVDNKVWYRVNSGESSGWVNSTALFGQKLR